MLRRHPLLKVQIREQFSRPPIHAPHSCLHKSRRHRIIFAIDCQETFFSSLLESKRTIEIEQFVSRSEIDLLYLRDPYYIVPDGEVGQQAFAVMREAIRKEGMVALGKIVFTL